MVAKSGRICIVAYANETGKWEPTLSLLKTCCGAFARGEVLRLRLEEDLEIVTKNLEAECAATNVSKQQTNQSEQARRSEQTDGRKPQPSPIQPTQKKTGSNGIDKLNKYCLVCEKEHGPYLEKCCTRDSLVAVHKERFFKKRVRYFTLEGVALDETELARLRKIAKANYDSQRSGYRPEASSL
jgi:hypothetical protein